MTFLFHHWESNMNAILSNIGDVFKKFLTLFFPAKTNAVFAKSLGWKVMPPILFICENFHASRSCQFPAVTSRAQTCGELLSDFCIDTRWPNALSRDITPSFPGQEYNTTLVWWASYSPKICPQGTLYFCSMHLVILYENKNLTSAH